jgi:hypothetical protein
MYSHHVWIASCLNVAERVTFLQCAVQSAKKQTYPTTVVLSVCGEHDDGSSSYGADIVLHQEPGKIVPQMKQFSLIADYIERIAMIPEFVTTMDDDDLLHPRRADMCIKKMQKTSAQVARCTHIRNCGFTPDLVTKTIESAPKDCYVGEAIEHSGLTCRAEVVFKSLVKLFKYNCKDKENHVLDVFYAMLVCNDYPTVRIDDLPLYYYRQWSLEDKQVHIWRSRQAGTGATV